MQQGVDWCGALCQTRLIRTSDAVVIRAAERAGNLKWALQELGDNVLRRLAQDVDFRVYRENDA